MKKFIVFGIVIAVVALFSLPSLLFAETGDEYTYSGTDDGQYTMDSDDADTAPDTDVYCVDDDTGLNDDTDAYTETDEMVSDVLQIDGEGGNFGPGIDEENAEAVEIIATTATGASDEDNQDAVWDIINDDIDSTPDDVVEEVVLAVMSMADGFVLLPENNDADDTNDTSLQEYLDDENVNEVEVILDDDPLLDANGDYNTFEAAAIMENPLVPGVTDEEKNTFWYIMDGSYNVSFSLTELIVTATSTMSDYEDDNDSSNAEDTDGDGEITGDNYGFASIPYYFYWWGMGYPEFEAMNACIFAWVDIDEDCKLDIQDISTDDPEDDPDGDVVGDFINDYQVIEVGLDGNIVDVNPDPDIVVAGTVPITDTQIECTEQVENTPCSNGHWHDNWNASGQRWWDCDWTHPHHHVADGPHDGYYYQYEDVTVAKDFEFDVCEQVGGKMLEAAPRQDENSAPCSSGHWHDNWDSLGRREWDCRHTDNRHDGYYYQYHYHPYQRFTIENYSEPFDKSCAPYEAWSSFEMLKSNSVTLVPVPGATYLLKYISGQTYEPDITEYFQTTDVNGLAFWSGLPWGEYDLSEVPPPPLGYLLDSTHYTVLLGGNALFEEEGVNVDGGLKVTNDPVPPRTPPTTTTTTTTTKKTTTTPGVIEVLGIQELPFTGMDPIIPISGASTIFAGGLMVVLSTIRKRFGKK